MSDIIRNHRFWDGAITVLNAAGFNFIEIQLFGLKEKYVR